MAQFVLQFAVSYILTRLSQKNGPRLKNLKGFTADYGAAIPRIYGPENRFSDATVIWATPIRETVHKHKPKTDYLFGIVGALLPSQKTYTYSVDFAALLCANPIARVKRMWANKKLIFDIGADTGTTYVRGEGKHKEFNSIRIYTGTFDQDPDPTIEADKGMGNVPAYLGLSYVVVDELQLENFGNGVPYEIEFEVEEAATCTLRRIVIDLAESTGIDPNIISTSGVNATVRGLTLADQSTVSDTYQRLADAYAFDVADVAGGLRFIPRGRYPLSTIPLALIGGHDADDDRPEPIRFSHNPEIGLPQEVSVSFFDPARDYQPNVATTRRSAGSSDANISVDSGLVLDADEAQDMADRIMWEAWSARDSAFAYADDRRQDVSAGEVHAFATPTGYDTYRVLRRTRGANGVMEWQLAADRPQLYDYVASGIPAPVNGGSVLLPEPINDPVFIEPPPVITNGSVQLWIAVCGGNGVTASGGSYYHADPTWPGVTVYIASEDVEAAYRLAGAISGAAYMGVLTKPLELTSGASPDVVGVLGVDLSMSLGVLESVSDTDASGGIVNLAWVEDGSGGEFLTFRDQVSTQPYVYDCTTLYRGLHGTVETLHAEGASFVMIDDALLRLEIPSTGPGTTLYFKFVQPMQSLAEVPAYPYTIIGDQFIALPPSGATITASVRTQTDGTSLAELLISWTPSLDPLLDHYDVELSADGGSTFFSAGSAGQDATSLSYQAAVAATNYIARVRAVSSVTGGVPSTYATSPATSSGAVPAASGSFVLVQASEALTAGRIVSFWNSGGARVRHADDTDDTKQADGFVLANVAMGDIATVFLPGAVITLAGLTPGALYFLGTSGQVTAVQPTSSGQWLQEIGRAADATHLPFAPKQGTLL